MFLIYQGMRTRRHVTKRRDILAVRSLVRPIPLVLQSQIQVPRVPGSRLSLHRMQSERGRREHRGDVRVFGRVRVQVLNRRAVAHGADGLDQIRVER